LAGEEEKLARLVVKLGRIKEWLAILVCGVGAIYLCQIGKPSGEATAGILGAIIGYALGVEARRRVRGEEA